jgi:hypothetical protein
VETATRGAHYFRFFGRVKNISPKRTRIFRDSGDYAESFFPRRKTEATEDGAFAGIEQVCDDLSHSHRWS